MRKNPNQKYTKELAHELGEELIRWLIADERNIFFTRFLLIEKGLHKSTFHYLCKKYEFFNEYIDTAKEIQKIKLCEGGLFGGFNSRITQLVLACHHNMRDEEKKEEKKDDSKGSTLIILSD